MAEVGGGRLDGLGPEPVQELELAPHVVVPHRIDGEAVALEAVDLDPPAGEHGDGVVEEDAVPPFEAGPTV